MASYVPFKDQLQRNLVAIISLFIAVSSLGYNTWRDEKTEYNRNQRLASLEVLLKLGELQELVFYSHYDRDAEDKGNPRSGWALALTIRDLSQVLEAPLPATSTGLVATWEQHWSELGATQASADAILESVDRVRSDALGYLARPN